MIFQGSSYNLPAHGSGGARARFNLKPAAKLPAEAKGEAPSEAANSIWWTWRELNPHLRNANAAFCR